VTTLSCRACRAGQPLDSPAAQCPACGGLLELEPEALPQSAAELRALFRGRRGAGPAVDASGVWRFRELVLPEAAPEEVVSQPEGNTPLLFREPIARWAGADALLLKHEGHNPTGSFKDRGMTVGITQARRVRARAVACASTGNTSASLAAYAALAAVPALVFVPAGQVALGKLAQTLAYGARTLLVRGDFDACLRLAREAAAALGVYLLNSVNPFRLAGQRTIVLELLDQMDWEPPDWIALPAGNLGNTAAFGAALRQAVDCGLLARVPRLLCVQASGANPFARAWRDGFARKHTVSAETVATAIRIGDPASYERAVEAVRFTNGAVAEVGDDEILEAKAVIDAAGVGCEPASAAAVAGVRRLRAEGLVASGERVVAVLTGHILKDPTLLVRYHQETEPPPRGANRPREIGPELAEVERVLREG
jgi:threonine synthase